MTEQKFDWLRDRIRHAHPDDNVIINASKLTVLLSSIGFLDENYSDREKQFFEQKTELEKLKRENAGLRKRIITMPMEVFDKLLQQAREEGTQSAIDMLSNGVSKQIPTPPCADESQDTALRGSAPSCAGAGVIAKKGEER